MLKIGSYSIIGATGLLATLNSIRSCAKKQVHDETIKNEQYYMNELRKQNYKYDDIQILKNYKFNKDKYDFGLLTDDINYDILYFAKENSLNKIAPFNRLTIWEYRPNTWTYYNMDSKVYRRRRYDYKYNAELKYDEDIMRTDAYIRETKRNKAFIDEKTKLGYNINDIYLLLILNYYVEEFRMFNNNNIRQKREYKKKLDKKNEKITL